MSVVRRGVAAALAAAVVLVVGTAPAWAADGITIEHVDTDRGSVSLLVSTDGVPPGVTVEASQISVELNGSAVDTSAKLVDAGDINRSTVIVLDASNSMKGRGKFAAATTAINAFLDTAPDDVAIGLVAFAGSITSTVAPTTDHDAVRQALTEVQLSRGTNVYDAVVEGVKLLQADGARNLLVLSDGADTGSSMTPEVATADAKEAGVVVDVVSLVEPAGSDELAAIAAATNGSVIPADPDVLTSVFNERADALAQQLLVSFEAPYGTGADANIDVVVDAGGTAYHDTAFTTLGPGFEVPDVVTSGKALVGNSGMLIGAATLAVGLFGLLAVALIGSGDNRSQSVRQLDAYFNGAGGANGKKQKKATTSADLKGSAVSVANKFVSADLETKISQRLSGAGSALTASEWVLLHVGIAVTGGVVGLVMGGASLSILGLLLGIGVPWVYLRFRHSRRLGAFNGQLAQTLSLMAGGLQAGLSLPQAVDTVVREGHEPMAGELRRALVEQRLGVDITDALDGVGERMESEDFGWVVMAVRIQREVGGNLAEILHTVSETLREREYLRRQVKALSAEGRLSGYILTGLPPLIFFYMTFANPEYVRLLYTTLPGYIILAVALFLLSLGSFAMAKLATVKV
ncbi:type II secretion system F family protein [Nocardioides hwasunensis]|uniref:Type II secretion system F family protein n=1 Tax=Nocardioides hwasunensis TaxID=397258 RepID=A0ABR8MF92_9ACTN|nr:type II secretion system F family protein [Nocardioides hwasunensis]MBD3913402.1 type II secretion system F family protein [Nocardioides hwasunensis]